MKHNAYNKYKINSLVVVAGLTLRRCKNIGGSVSDIFRKMANVLMASCSRQTRQNGEKKNEQKLQTIELNQ